MSRIPNLVNPSPDQTRQTLQRITAPTLQFTIAGPTNSVTNPNQLADRYTLDSTATLAQTQQFLATVCRALVSKGIINGKVTT